MQRPFFPSSRRAAGFTLVELLVAVAIVGILGAIAYPAYTQHIVKGNRAAAQAYLLSLAQAETDYFADARSYTTSTAALHLDPPANFSAKYTLDIQVPPGNPPSFTLTAIPIVSGTQHADGNLSIDSSGARLPTDKW